MVWGVRAEKAVSAEDEQEWGVLMGSFGCFGPQRAGNVCEHMWRNAASQRRERAGKRETKKGKMRHPRGGTGKWWWWWCCCCCCCRCWCWCWCKLFAEHVHHMRHIHHHFHHHFHGSRFFLNIIFMKHCRQQYFIIYSEKFPRNKIVYQHILLFRKNAKVTAIFYFRAFYFGIYGMFLPNRPPCHV